MWCLLTPSYQKQGHCRGEKKCFEPRFVVMRHECTWISKRHLCACLVNKRKLLTHQATFCDAAGKVWNPRQLVGYIHDGAYTVEVSCGIYNTNKGVETHTKVKTETFAPKLFHIAKVVGITVLLSFCCTFITSSYSAQTVLPVSRCKFLQCNAIISTAIHHHC